MGSEDFSRRCDVVKVDDQLGLVFGFSIVCKVDGEDYYDTQGDAIDEQGMLEAAFDFARSPLRVSTDQHARTEEGDPSPDGEVVFMFPLTTEVAKALGIECRQSGLLTAMRPSPEVFKGFQDGRYTGFSIGGKRVDEEVVEW